MKIIVDLDNPDDVAQAVALLTGENEGRDAPLPTPVVATPSRAPAARGPAAAGKPAAPPSRTPPAAGRPAPGRAQPSAPQAAKARFAEYGAAIGVAVTNISSIPADDYENALTWFAVE